MKSPAFQFYPGDYLSSARVAELTLEEEGAYCRALFFCWSNKSLPADEKRLANIIGKGCTIEIARIVKDLFEVSDEDPTKLVHSRLDEERRKQAEWAEKSRQGGIASAASRRGNSDFGRQMAAKKKQKRTNQYEATYEPTNEPENEAYYEVNAEKKGDLAAEGSRDIKTPELYEPLRTKYEATYEPTTNSSSSSSSTNNICGDLSPQPALNFGDNALIVDRSRSKKDNPNAWLSPLNKHFKHAYEEHISPGFNWAASPAASNKQILDILVSIHKKYEATSKDYRSLDIDEKHEVISETIPRLLTNMPDWINKEGAVSLSFISKQFESIWAKAFPTAKNQAA